MASASRRNNPTEPYSRGGQLSFILAVVLLILFSFSSDIGEAVYNAAGQTQPSWLLLAVDSFLLIVSFGFTVRLWVKSIRPGIFPVTLWLVSAALIVFVDYIGSYVLVFYHVEPPVGTMPPSAWLEDLAFSILYVLLLALLLAAIAGVDPFRKRESGKNRLQEAASYRFKATLPFLGGTVAAYVASIVWYYQLNRNAIRTYSEAENEVRRRTSSVFDARPDAQLFDIIQRTCTGAVNQQFFAQAAQIVPLLLVALALESRFLERVRGDPVTRAVGSIAVILLLASEILVVSALPESNNECDHILFGWHEYAAYIVTVEAIVVSLLYLLWTAFGKPPSDPAVAGQLSSPAAVPRRAALGDGGAEVVGVVGLFVLMAARLASARRNRKASEPANHRPLR